MLHKIDGDQKEIVFMWVSGYVGIRGKEAAVWAAKEVLDKQPLGDLMLFSDLKPFTNIRLFTEWSIRMVNDTKTGSLYSTKY